MHSYGLDSNPSSEDDENSDVELMDVSTSEVDPRKTLLIFALQGTSLGAGNHMNNMLTNMYSVTTRPSGAQNADEAIDISSDDDDGDGSTKTKNINGKQSNEQHILKLISFAGRLAEQIDDEFTKMQSAPLAKAKETNARAVELLISTSTEPQQANPKKRKIDGRRESTVNTEAGMQKSNKENPLSIGRPLKKFKREFALAKSSVTFQNVGGVDKILKELCELLLHVKHPNVYKHIGLPPPRGFLLLGPPGCGKTLLAEAIAGVSRSARLLR